MKRLCERICMIMIGAALGYGSLFLLPPDRVEATLTELRSDTASLFTNPLLECDFGAEYISKNAIKPFRLKIQDEIQILTSNGNASVVAYYFRDLNNGAWFGINEWETFTPASLLKLPILLQILKKIELGSLDPTTAVEVTKLDKSTYQHIKPEYSIEEGKTYTIEKLLEQMIIESDNNAAEVLANILGERDFQEIFKDFKIEVPVTEKEYLLSVKNYASFFRILFNASYLTQENSEAALGLLSRVKFKEGIVDGVPNNIIVAHKFGERELTKTNKQLHDCGIVYYPKSPYLLCIMARGTDYNALKDTIRKLSEITYSEVDKQKK